MKLKIGRLETTISPIKCIFPTLKEDGKFYTLDGKRQVSGDKYIIILKNPDSFIKLSEEEKTFLLMDYDSMKNKLNCIIHAVNKEQFIDYLIKYHEARNKI